MSEGTRSLLIGCHNIIIHPIVVILGWKYWFGKYPKLWQIVCIFLHDIGIAGREYLSDNEAKKGHWILGAEIAGKLFGKKGYLLCAGHTPESGYPRSELWYADKISWIIAPMSWLWSNFYMEGFNVAHPYQWKILVAKNIIAENHFSGHELYIKEIKK